MGSIEVKEGDDVAVVIEKIAPKAGELIILNMKKSYPEKAVRDFAKNLKRILPKGVQVVVNNNDMSLKYLSEEKLNELGYFSLPTATG